MPRFFVPRAELGENFLVLTGENAAHARVLRLKNGDAVPDFGSVGWNHDGITEYVIPWVALDPTELAELRIYRGGTTQNLPLIEKSPG